MSYALFDRQNNSYLATGYGASSLEQLHEELFEYIEVDLEPDEIEYWELLADVREMAATWDLRIDEGRFEREW